MTRKHFEEFAELLAKHTVTNQLIIDLCQIFKKDNPRFDASTFIYYYQDKMIFTIENRSHYHYFCLC